VLDPPATVAVSPTLADDDLAIALAGLRAEDAEVLWLWAWEELTAGQIALTLNISPNAASIRLHRAKQRLREELGKLDRRAGHEHTSEGRRP
jgi:RNA polymerase sigma-70 factor (ECF subfamily)